MDFTGPSDLAETDPVAAITAAWRQIIEAQQNVHARLDPAFVRHGALGRNVPEIDALITSGNLDQSFIGVAAQLWAEFNNARFSDETTGDALDFIARAQPLGDALETI